MILEPNQLSGPRIRHAAAGAPSARNPEVLVVNDPAVLDLETPQSGKVRATLEGVPARRPNVPAGIIRVLAGIEKMRLNTIPHRRLVWRGGKLPVLSV